VSGDGLPRWLEVLLDDAARARLAARLDTPIVIAFNIIRNAGFVAIARFIALESRNPAFTLVYAVLALLLVVQIASRFMLQPQIPVFRGPLTARKRVAQGGVNMALCAAACMIALWGIDLLVRGMIEFRLAAP